MAISLTSLSSTTVVYDADATNAMENDVRGGPTTLYGYYVDNAEAAATGSYLKLWDNQAPTLGTTDPDYIFQVEGATDAGAAGPPGVGAQVNAGDTFVTLNGGVGIAFTNGLSFACVKGAETSDTTAPDDTVKVTLLTS